MTWDASLPLHDHLPPGDARLSLCTQIQRDAIEEDRARWHLAQQMITTKSEHEIRRWLEQQHPVYRADMARRLNDKTGRTNPAGRPGQ